MKRSMQLLCAIVTIAVSNVAYGWNYTFKNLSGEKIGVRIKLRGVFEPWYYGTIEAGGAYTFEIGVNKEANLDLEGTKKEYTGRKAGMCLAEVEVMNYSKSSDGWIATPSKNLYQLSRIETCMNRTFVIGGNMQVNKSH